MYIISQEAGDTYFIYMYIDFLLVLFYNNYDTALR